MAFSSFRELFWMVPREIEMDSWGCYGAASDLDHRNQSQTREWVDPSEI